MTNSWANEPNGHLLIDAEWLNNHIDDPNLRIFDCTTRLIPDDKLGYRIEDARDNWAAGHIRGSGYLNCQSDMCDTNSKFRFMLSAPHEFARSVGSLGIGDNTKVVLYSTAELFWSTRAWWALYANGFDNAVILNGGLQEWINLGHPISTDPCTYPETTFTPKRRNEVIVDKNQVLSSIGDQKICLINALSEEQYRGTGGMVFGRPGHIPGSGNAPYSALANFSTGTLNDPDTVKRTLEKSGAIKDDKIVNYCGGGISATIGFFAQKLLGYENIALYDASMQEWGFDKTLPIETSK